MSGKLIVIEGIDGSGKATQSRLLVDYFISNGKMCKGITFPRYGNPSASLVELYLGGGLGDNPDDVSPYAASLFYSVDRYCSYKQDWGEFYNSGGIVVADRYTTSNAVHQSSKLSYSDRDVYLSWLFSLEYDILKLPKPDLVIYLDVPLSVSKSLMLLRDEQTNTKSDIHEKNLDYLDRCKEVSKYLIDKYGWKKVNCSYNGYIRPVDEIHNHIVNLLGDF